MMSRFAPVLKKVSIFSTLSDEACDELCNLVAARHYAKDELLFRQGDPGDELFIVASGCIKIFLGSGESERVLAFLSDGETVGEMALLTGEPRSASAAALVDSRVLVIPKDGFDRLVLGHTPAMVEMARVIARRQARTNESLVPKMDLGAVETAPRLQALTIQIDREDVQEAVDEICAADFFEELESKASQLRHRVHEQ